MKDRLNPAAVPRAAPLSVKVVGEFCNLDLDSVFVLMCAFLTLVQTAKNIELPKAVIDSLQDSADVFREILTTDEQEQISAKAEVKYES